ncbi:MAG: phage holin family protein [Clostridia bacterium]|nr:phage holin family protein [Clostridia bacterium]
MKYFKLIMKVGFTAVFSAISYLVGGFDLSVIVLCGFMAIDYITGVIVAITKNTVSSKQGAKGIAKKVLIIFILITAVLLDRLISKDQWIFRTLVCCFYTANEGISIIENAASLGIPIPKKLKEILIQLNNDNN